MRREDDQAGRADSGPAGDRAEPWCDQAHDRDADDGGRQRRKHPIVELPAGCSDGKPSCRDRDGRGTEPQPQRVRQQLTGDEGRDRDEEAGRDGQRSLDLGQRAGAVEQATSSPQQTAEQLESAEHDEQPFGAGHRRPRRRHEVDRAPDDQEHGEREQDVLSHYRAEALPDRIALLRRRHRPGVGHLRGG